MLATVCNLRCVFPSHRHAFHPHFRDLPALTSETHAKVVPQRRVDSELVEERHRVALGGVLPAENSAYHCAHLRKAHLPRVLHPFVQPPAVHDETALAVLLRRQEDLHTVDLPRVRSVLGHVERDQREPLSEHSSRDGAYDHDAGAAGLVVGGCRGPSAGFSSQRSGGGGFTARASGVLDAARRGVVLSFPGQGVLSRKESAAKRLRSQ